MQKVISICLTNFLSPKGGGIMRVDKKTLARRLSMVLVTLLLLMFVFSDEAVRGGDDLSFTIQGTDSEIKITLNGIDPLANGFHYEGWAIINDAPVATGKFNIDEAGKLVDLDGNPIADSTFTVTTDLSAATAIVITIEPAGDTDDMPATTKYLGGAVADNTASLSPAFAGAFGDDFLSATGKYILATPTNGPDSNENSGIWFLQFVSNTVALSFDGLDSLNNGYHYEGWAIIAGQPFSTGKFNVNSAGAIVDLEGNIIENGEFGIDLDLSTASDIVLTIEPPGDNDTMPASTKFLGGALSGDSADLSVGHPGTLDNDFGDAAGKYILATPTDGANTNENSGIWFLDPTSNALQLTDNSLAPLANGFHYEGWAIVDGNAITTGKFNVNDSGEIVDLDGNVFPNGTMPVETDISMATDIVITIEPAGDTDTVPAVTHIIAGGVSDGSAELNVSAPQAFDDDFTTATGKYILATPTNGADSDENSGIWFLDNSGTDPVAGLTLPALPAGWNYEGWAVINGMPVSTGTFTDVAAADDAAPYSGAEAGPPFPGEDFLLNAPGDLSFPVDLAGKTAVISIEPSPDDSDSPFFMKPLVGTIPGDATDHTVYEMMNNTASFPTASARIVRPVAGLSLPALPDGWKYEGWAVIDGTPVTTGTFTDLAAADDAAPYSGSEEGPPFPGEDFLMNAPGGLTFPINLAGMTAVISIEPSPDDSPTPFVLKPLVGMIPSDAMDHTVYELENKSSGFPTGTARLVSNPAAGLGLPELPAGWEYEGWVVIDGSPVTTGKFTKLDSADLSAPFSGMTPGPPFPGEDLLENAPEGLTFPTDLAGVTAVISIEPSPDDSPMPFTLKPLVGMIPMDAADHIVYEMGNNAENFPSGTADLTVVTSVLSPDDEGLPSEFSLSQNYPNPFNPSTVIQFNTLERGHVKLTIFNLLGQQVAELLNEELSAGPHKITFDATGIPAGIYLYRLEAGDNTEVRKMTFLK